LIVCFVDIGGIIDHHCLEVIVHFVDIGGIIGHHCLEVIVRFVDIDVNYQPSLPKYSFYNVTGISTPTA
jgi:hypothetical protein